MDSPTPGPADGELERFAAMMRRLRAECPWKRAQTHLSLVRFLQEEAAETVEAIETGTPAELCGELGDLLLQVFLHAAIAEETGDFTLDDVARGISDKMIRRNPHVFGPAAAGTAGELDPAEVDELWQQVKDTERPDAAVEAGVPAALPALLYADKLAGRLERAGRPITVAPDADDPGERLLALVVELRTEGVDAEQALRGAVRRRLATAAGTEVAGTEVAGITEPSGEIGVAEADRPGRIGP